MFHLPWVTSSITPVMAMSPTSCFKGGGTGTSHLHACPSPGSTHSSADFITSRIISWPHGWTPWCCHPPGHLLVPLPAAWDLPQSPQKRCACESLRAEPGSGCWLQAGSPHCCPGPVAPPTTTLPSPLSVGPRHRGQLPPGKAVKHPEERPLQLGSGITKFNPRSGLTLLQALRSFPGLHRH